MKRHIAIVAPKFLDFLEYFSPLGKGGDGKVGIANITLSPFIISAKPMSEVDSRHEIIHIHQQQECSLLLTLVLLSLTWLLGWWTVPLVLLMWLPLVGPFYWLYLAFYLIGLVKYRNIWKESDLIRATDLGDFAYYRIPFEQESYTNHHSETYIEQRKPFAWIKYKV
ncbi:MAG: hypothetical protein ACW96N_00280 [Candidatus Thorarchaeota archaeon]|jgi:hypothetical protein